MINKTNIFFIERASEISVSQEATPLQKSDEKTEGECKRTQSQTLAAMEPKGYGIFYSIEFNLRQL